MKPRQGSNVLRIIRRGGVFAANSVPVTKAEIWMGL